MIFFAFLTQDLDGEKAHGDAELMGLFFAAQILGSASCYAILQLITTLAIEAQAQLRAARAMAEHVERSRSAEPDGRVDASAHLEVRKRRVRLIKESSTLFTRAASSQVGFDLEAATPTTPRRRRVGSGSADLGSAEADLEAGRSEALVDPEAPPPARTECAICFEVTADAVVRPCGHGGLCYECGKKLLKTKSRCPLCRASIREILVYDPEATPKIDEEGREVIVTHTSADRGTASVRARRGDG